MDHRITVNNLSSINLTNLAVQFTDIDLLSMIFTIIVGVFTGILIIYLTDVLPRTRRLTQPVCWECDQPYNIKDYLLIHKCPNCGHRRSARSVIILIGTILCSLLLQFFPFANLNFWATLPILIFLGVILVIDIEHRLVLFETSLFGFVLFTIYGIIFRGFSGTFFGALGGLLIMLLFYITGIIFSKIIGKLRHREISEVAFGFGDVMAGTFIGLLAGWPAIVGVIIFAIIAFSAFSLILIISLLLSKRYQAFAKALPFTPFLILGVITIFYLQ